MGRENGSLLPSRQRTDLITGEVDRSLPLPQRFRRHRTLRPRSFLERNPLPCAADSGFDFIPVSRMDVFACGDGHSKALLRAHGAKAAARFLAPDAGSENDSLVAVTSVWRIPDLRDVLIRPGDTVAI